MEVINMKVKDLIPYENNPRKNDKAVSALAFHTSHQKLEIQW